MKARISRQNHRPARHYSGLYQIQGSMVTDADLGEQVEIGKSSVALLGTATIGSGVPAAGGCIAFVGGKASLQSGQVVADGIAATFVSGGKAGETRTHYETQQDFSTAPALPGNDKVLLYADVWERSVSHLEDAALTDPGLHNAETSVRTRTMAQVRYAPVDDAALIGQTPGPYPRKGNGSISATIALLADAKDGCDPCAEELTAEARLGNALFRVEVVHVEGPADKPSEIHLAWSMENGAEACHTSDIPDGFTEPSGAVFELFTLATEQHKGAFHPAQAPQRAKFVTSKEELAAQDPNAWPYVRRWNGHAQVALPSKVLNSNSGASATDSAVTIVQDLLTVEIDFKNKCVLAGDYWLVEVREFAAEDQRARVVSAEPLGIEHHYVPLFVYDTAADTARDLSDAEVRKLSFPSLTGIPASHVSVSALCANIYDGAENVQQALEAICKLDATDIAYAGCTKIFGASGTVAQALDSLCTLSAAQIDFSDGCANSDLFHGAATVQSAFDRICGIEARHIGFTDNCNGFYGDAKTAQEAFDAICNREPRLEPMLRLLFDWGVVCGVKASIDWAEGNPRLVISAGHILDRLGRLIAVPRMVSDLNSNAQLEALLKRPDVIGGRAVCVAIGMVDKDLQIVFGFHDDLVKPGDPTVQERIAACHAKKKLDWLPGVLETWNEDSVGKKLLLAASSSELYKNSLALPPEEANRSRELLADLKERFRNAASAAEIATLESDMQTIEEANNFPAAAGMAAHFIAGNIAQEKLQWFGKFNGFDETACICDAIYPDCPPEPENVSPFVPVASLRFGKPAEIAKASVCLHECRKQALTPRSQRYYEDPVRVWIGKLAEEYKCCPQDEGIFPFPLDPVFPMPEPLFPVSPTWPIKLDPFPKLKGLDKFSASEILKGNGVTIKETVDLGKAEALDKILELKKNAGPLAFGGGAEAIAPGDEVALLMRDGEAVGYTVTRKGTGRYLFDPGTASAGPADGGIDIGAIASKLGALRTERDTLKLDIDSLAARRAKAEDDVTGLASRVDALSAADAELRGQIAASQDVLAAIRAQQAEAVAASAQLLTDLQASREQLAGVRAQHLEASNATNQLQLDMKSYQAEFERIRSEHANVIGNMYRAMPVATVVADPAVAATLNDSGISTVDALLTADDARLRRIVRTHPGVDVTALRESGNRFITR